MELSDMGPVGSVMKTLPYGMGGGTVGGTTGGVVKPPYQTRIFSTSIDQTPMKSKPPNYSFFNPYDSARNQSLLLDQTGYRSKRKPSLKTFQKTKRIDLRLGRLLLQRQDHEVQLIGDREDCGSHQWDVHCFLPPQLV